MTVRIRIRDGLDGELATPEVAGSAPCVVVVHEWHGLNAGVRGLCDRFAEEGFVALAPDLYHGEVATNDERAAELMNRLSTKDAMDDLAASVAYLKAASTTPTSIGVVGFCMGGAMAFAAATAVSGITCAVPFYGIPTAAYWDPAKVRVPIQAHFATHDAWAKADRAREHAAAVNAKGGHMELFVYEAGHAFMREGDPETYDAAAAALAWSRTIAFLRERLGPDARG